MITQTLHIRYTRTPQRPAAAWLISGSEPAAWLHAVSQCRCDHANVRIRVLPASLTDRRSVAALVTLGEAKDYMGSTIPGAAAYGIAASRLFLPVDARFDPEVTDAELTAMLAGDREYVWHPHIGLVAFESSEVLRLSDLLAVGGQRPAAWNAAVPGVSLAPRLLSLEPLSPPSLETMIEESRGDIGSRAGEIEYLPQSDAERPSGPLSAIGAMGLQSLAYAVRFLASLAPTSATSPTWINSLEQWAMNTLGGIAAASLANRFKELHRLLSMLEQDPEEGLKFALPLGGESHRGLAPPSDRLGRRDTDFRLGALRGGQAADFWDVPQDLRLQLTARYRELATREIRLGRHRRAAYIYAQLLFDLPAAASTLAAGGHYREAAALYREKLKRPLEAAECLERGGLWSEAIALYVELQQFEKAGDLHAQLGQLEEAHAQYRCEVSRLTSLHDRIAAARVLEFKLSATDEAIALLDEGWPHAPHAHECLVKLFEVLARNGRHELSRRRVESLRQAPLPTSSAVAVVETLSLQGEIYVDADIRRRAGDAARVVASRWLAGSSQGEAQRIVAALGRAARHDRLLQRDGQRYLQRRKRPLLPKPPVRCSSIERIHHYRLTNDCEFRAAISVNNLVYAAGVRGDGLEVWRCLWESESGYATARLPHVWRLDPTVRHNPILLAANPTGDDRLLVHVLGSNPLPPIVEAKFGASGVFRTNVQCGAVAGVSQRTIAAVRGPKLTWLANLNDADINLVAFSDRGPPVFDYCVPATTVDIDDLMQRPSLWIGEPEVYFAFGSGLFAFNRKPEPRFVALHSDVVGIAHSPRNTRKRIAVAMVEGAVLFWDGQYDSQQTSPWAAEMERPVIAFTPGGYLVAADDRQVQVYRTTDGKLQCLGQLETPDLRPIAVLSLSKPNEFSVVSAHGVITTYSV